MNGFAAVAEALSRAQDNGNNPEITVVGGIDLDTGEPSITEALVLTGGTISNKMIYVLPNSTLFLGNGANDVILDNTKIYVLGTLTADVTNLTLQNSAEIFCRLGSSAPTQVCNMNVDNLVIESNGCLLVNDGATANISGNLTFQNQGFLAHFGGDIVLEDNTILDYKSTAKPLVIDAGSTFLMGQNAQVVFRRPVTITGTSSNPVRFQRSGSSAWKEVTLLADGNTFDYVVFDGGTQNVNVASKNNTFKHVRSKNGWRGFSSGYDYTGGGRSSFTLDNVVIDSSTSVGLVGYHADITMRNSTVINSAQAGIWLTDASTAPFVNSVVESNGRISSTRSGVEVNYGGYIESGEGDGGYDRGYNRIKSNAYHEVKVASGGDAELGSTTYEGYNAIYDPGDASTTDAEKFIYNAGVVDANVNYWGTTSAPPSGQFYGTIFRPTYLTYDPTGGSGGHNVPQMVASPMLASAVDEPEMTLAPMQHFEVSSVLTPGSASCDPSPEAAGLLFTSTEDACVAGDMDLRSRMAIIRGRLMDSPTSAQAPVLLRMLYGLQMTDRADSLGEKAANMAVIASFRERLTSGSATLAGETAALLEIRDAMLGERYDEAARILGSYDGLIESTDNRRQLLLEKTFLLEAEGDYTGALAAFEQFKAIRPSDASLPGYTPADYSIVEATLQEEMNAPGVGKTAPALEAAGKTEAELPEQLELGKAYPNPFRNTAVLPLSLPEAADVSIEVYDLLGRRVAVLAEGRLSAGRQVITLDGNGLSSGLYLIRARVEAEGGEARVFTRKVMLVK